MSADLFVNTETIVLIGPEGAGKSTVGKLVAPKLNKELYSLDRHRDELYAPYGYDAQRATKIYETQGVWAFFDHWNYFEFHAVSHVLENASKPGDPFYGKILDFGAGHSVFREEEQLAQIEKLMRPFQNVILLLPSQNADESLKITEERRGHQLELNALFLEHKSNASLAKHTVYTGASTPDESANEILGIIARNAASAAATAGLED